MVGSINISTRLVNYVVVQTIAMHYSLRFDPMEWRSGKTIAARDRSGTISYGLLERSVSLDALSDYAQSGQLTDDLYVYTRYVKSDQRQLLRRSLLVKSDLSVVAVSQFLYSPQGKVLLERLGQVIQPESRDNGLYALRAALILAANDSQGLTPLNVLRQFPTRGIRIDLQRSVKIAAELDDLITQTNRVSRLIAAQADRDLPQQPLPQPLPNLTLPGPVGFVREPIDLEDRNRIGPTGFARVRPVKFDLYTPARRRNRQYSVLVISHGVGSDRDSFVYLAAHLASHGFVVVVPAHPGSDAQQMAALLNGTAEEVAAPLEFVDRPLDVKFILDYLSSDNRWRYADWNNVGVIGQSFGGYTAFALAGGKLNFDYLQQSCNQKQQLNTWNISLLLQCRAAVLPPRNYDIADRRVKAIMTVNAIASKVFGPVGLGQVVVPTFVISGKADTVAPSIPEQIQPFMWLQSPERYLAVIDRSSHFSFIGEASSSGGGVQLPLPPELIGPSPESNRRYLNALSLAFFRTHLQQQSRFQPFLTASYARSISRDPLRIDLVRSVDLSSLGLSNSASP
jgi:predicted dienelactone hydrolase